MWVFKEHPSSESLKGLFFCGQSDPLLVNQQWYYSIYSFKATAIPERHSSGCRQDCGFCVSWFCHHLLLYPLRCKSTALQYRDTLKYVLKCDCHLRGRLASHPAQGNLHHPLAKPWQSRVGSLSELLLVQCLSWMWCRTLLSCTVSQVPFRSTVFTSTSAHMNYCLLNKKSNKFSSIQTKPQWLKEADFHYYEHQLMSSLLWTVFISHTSGFSFSFSFFLWKCHHHLISNALLPESKNKPISGHMAGF